MNVRVLVPFHFSATDKDYEPGDIIDKVTEEQLAGIRAVNVNMVEVVEEEEKPKKEKAEKKENSVIKKLKSKAKA